VQGLAYSSTQGDEVEDLLCLLAYAKEKMPQVEAVSSGAIASSYQRLRVENVTPCFPLPPPPPPTPQNKPPGIRGRARSISIARLSVSLKEPSGL